MTYCVYKTKGFEEPWWLNDDWKNNILDVQQFTTLEAAYHQYTVEKSRLSQQHTHCSERNNYMAAYWNKGDVAYCIPCENDEQLYTGIFIQTDQGTLSDEDLQTLQYLND